MALIHRKYIALTTSATSGTEVAEKLKIRQAADKALALRRLILRSWGATYGSSDLQSWGYLLRAPNYRVRTGQGSTLTQQRMGEDQSVIAHALIDSLFATAVGAQIHNCVALDIEFERDQMLLYNDVTLVGLQPAVNNAAVLWSAELYLEPVKRSGNNLYKADMY